MRLHTAECEEQRVGQTLDGQLDRELEDTFPASDALKITRRTPEQRFASRQDKSRATGDDRS